MTTNKAVSRNYTLAKAQQDLAQGKGETVVGSDGFRSWERIGDSLTGEYVGKEEGTVQGQPATFYTFNPLEGDEFFGVFDEHGEAVTLKCHGTTKIDQLMARVEPGSLVHIVYKADVHTANNFTMKDFDVVLLPGV